MAEIIFVFFSLQRKNDCKNHATIYYLLHLLRNQSIMKKSLLFLFVLLLGISCDKDDDNTEIVTVAVPITVKKADLRAQVDVVAPRAIDESGKFYFYKDYIFVNDSAKGVHIIDNSQPENPQKIAYLKVPGTYDMEVKGNILYVDSYTDLVLFDLHDINNIHLMDRYIDVLGDTNYTWPLLADNVWSFDFENYDYKEDLIVGWEYKQVKRKMDPGMVYFDGTMSLASYNTASKGAGVGGSFARFKIVGNRLYVVDHSALYTFDISSTEDVQKLNEQRIGWNIETIFNQDDYLYLGSSSGMFIFDIANPDAPAYVSQIQHLYGCDPVVVDGDYAYVTIRGGNPCGQDESILEVVDVSDKNNPTSVKMIDMNEPYGLGVHDDKLYVSDGPNGLHIYDKTDPVNIELSKIMEDIQIFDVIPLQDKLLMIGDNKLRQYSYSEDGLTEISVFDLQ